MKLLSGQIMREALTRLDELLGKKVSLLVGGGGAMVLAYQFPLATTDIDAIPLGMEIDVIDPLVKQVAREQGLAPDWLNPYFSTFAFTLPTDYGERLIEVFRGKNLVALALGRNELLIMKCFAHRQKDAGHARALISQGADVNAVESHLESLRKRNIPGVREALDFLDDIIDQMGNP
jgi:hypothetical protein